MKTGTFSIGVLLAALVWALPLGAAQRTVAVMNFTNHTGGIGLQYLAKSIPESLSATLSQSKDLRVVEREHLGKLLDEIALEQTGIFSEARVSRAGKLARADVLILGSYTGSPEQLVVSIKAIEVVSGKVIDGRVVKAPLAKVFDRANEAVLAMAAIIAGKSLGYLSVSTTPDGAEIYVDGTMVGKSPLVEYKLAEGRHRVKAVKSGRVDADTSITIVKDKYVSWSPFLAEDRIRDRTSMGLSVYYLLPVKTDIKGSPLYAAFLAHNFDLFILSAEAGYSRIVHDQTFPSVFGTDITQERWYNMYTLQGSLSFMPFPNWKYIQPYAGGIIGWLNLQDFHKDTTAEDEKEKLLVQNRLTLGLKAGAHVIPFSKVSIFIEGRYYYTPARLTRYAYESQLLGAPIEHHHKYYFNAFAIGGGIKYFFD